MSLNKVVAHDRSKAMNNTNEQKPVSRSQISTQAQRIQYSPIMSDIYNSHINMLNYGAHNVHVDGPCRYK